MTTKTAAKCRRIESPVTIAKGFDSNNTEPLIEFLGDVYKILLRELYDARNNSLFVTHIYPPSDSLIGKQQYQLTILSDTHGMISVMEGLPSTQTITTYQQDNQHGYKQLLQDFTTALIKSYSREIATRARRMAQDAAAQVPMYKRKKR